MAILTGSQGGFEPPTKVIVSDEEKKDIRKFLEKRGIAQITEETIMEFVRRNSSLYPQKPLKNNSTLSDLNTAVNAAIESQPYDYKEQLGIRDQQIHKGDRAMLSTSVPPNNPLLDHLLKNPK